MNLENVDSEVKVRIYDANSTFPHVGTYLQETVSHLSFAIAKAKLDLRAVNRNTLLCLLYTSPSPRDKRQSRMPSSA